MSKDQRKRIEIEELPRQQAEDLTAEEAEDATGGLNALTRLFNPSPPPVVPNVTELGPAPPPI